MECLKCFVFLVFATTGLLANSIIEPPTPSKPEASTGMEVEDTDELDPTKYCKTLQHNNANIPTFNILEKCDSLNGNYLNPMNKIDMAPAEYVQTFCRNFSSFDKCTKKYSNCFEGVELERIQRAIGIIQKAIDLGCKKNQEKIIEYVTKEGVKCSTILLGLMSFCIFDINFMHYSSHNYINVPTDTAVVIENMYTCARDVGMICSKQ